MNDIVYFIGGPLDLTKRAMPSRDVGRYFEVPTFGPERAVFHGPDSPVRLTYETIRYNLQRIGERTYVARLAEEEGR